MLQLKHQEHQTEAKRTSSLQQGCSHRDVLHLLNRNGSSEFAAPPCLQPKLYGNSLLKICVSSIEDFQSCSVFAMKICCWISYAGNLLNAPGGPGLDWINIHWHHLDKQLQNRWHLTGWGELSWCTDTCISNTPMKVTSNCLIPPQALLSLWRPH